MQLFFTMFLFHLFSISIVYFSHLFLTFYCYFYDAIFLILKKIICFCYFAKRICMRDKRLCINFSLCNQPKCLFAVTAIHSACFKCKILSIHIWKRQKLHRRQRIFSRSVFLSARARRHWPLSILQPSADTAHRPFWWYATIRTKCGTIRLIPPSIREKSMLPSLQMKWFWRRGMRASHPAGWHILIRRKSTAD